MIIVIQDKTEIVNFDNIMNINICGCKEDGYSISAGFIVGRDDNYRELGLYETEERAKKVLQELKGCYLSEAMVECNGYICYEMPEK